MLYKNQYMVYNIINMVNHTCYRCNYTTNRKYNMENHLSRKNICNAENNDIELNLCKEYILKGVSYKEYKEIIDKQHSNNIVSVSNNNITTTNNNITTTNNNINNTNNNITKQNIECEYCNKLFKYKWCKTRHLKICKVKSDINTTQ